MKRLQNRTSLKQLLVSAALVVAAAGSLAACNGGGGGMAGAGGGPMKVALVDWVTDLAVSYAPDTSAPDTVEDKVDIVVDTSDPAAFDPLLAQQSSQSP